MQGEEVRASLYVRAGLSRGWKVGLLLGLVAFGLVTFAVGVYTTFQDRPAVAEGEVVDVEFEGYEACFGGDSPRPECAEDEQQGFDLSQGDWNVASVVGAAAGLVAAAAGGAAMVARAMGEYDRARARGTAVRRGLAQPDGDAPEGPEPADATR